MSTLQNTSLTNQKARDVALDLNMSGLLLGKQAKNQKPEVRKMKAIINEYQAKLDQKVSQVITDLMNYSKKNNENTIQKNAVILPEISRSNASSHYYQNKSFVKHRKSDSVSSHMNNVENSFSLLDSKSANQKRRDKFISVGNNFNSIQNKNYDQSFNSGFTYGSQRNAAISFINKREHEDLKDFQGVKISEKANKTDKANKADLGRSIGTKIYRKPKPLRREVQILSKEMRWNPFCQKNAIKAQQLDQGMLNLIQKGKIGKDVDIISAFEKGRPVLDSKPAIFHHAEQKFNQDQGVVKLPRHLRKRLQSEISHQRSQINDNNAWAITAPPMDSIEVDDKIKRDQGQKFIQINLQSTVYLRFLHYKVIQDSKFHQVRKTNYQIWPNIKLILASIGQFLELYTHENIYVNFSKVLKIALMVRKPNESQIMECIVIPKGQNPRKYLKSLKCVNNIERKRQMAANILKSVFKANLYRVRYLKAMKRRKIEFKLVMWAVNGLLIRNCRKQMIEARKQVQQKYVEIQRKFKQNYSQIVAKKHYQIHLPNKQHWTPQKYKQILNTDIVRIFDLNNINTFVIYLCPFQLTQDTTSYYYKIMELQQIPNYKERVTFLEVNSDKKLPFKMSMSEKLYYNSNTIKNLKNKIKDSPAYFVTSYPTQIDINISAYMNIPIFSGNLLQLRGIHKRSLLKANFQSSNTLAMLKLTGKNSVFQISIQIIRFCESFKDGQRFVIKLDDHYQSSGVALVAYPFSSLPEIYQKTTLISGKYRAIDSFYLRLAKKGGIIQKYDQNITPISVIGKIDQLGQAEILGTFEKISYGFVNVGYLFPQRSVPHRIVIQESNKVMEKLKQKGHFGQFQITYFADKSGKLNLQKVQTYFTRIGASLHYFKFLSDGQFNNLGIYMTKIYENYQQEMGQINSEMPLQEARGYCFIPYLLHFGLSQRQASSFFQLCRMGGVSFDLENKYGSTFILLGNLKSSLGIITTAKDRKNTVKLMLNCLDFLVKQNSHNVSNQILLQRQSVLKERTNINSMKQILEGYM